MKPTAEALHLLHYTESVETAVIPYANHYQLVASQLRPAGPVNLSPYVYEHPRALILDNAGGVEAYATVVGVLDDNSAFNETIWLDNDKQVLVLTADGKTPYFFKNIISISLDTSIEFGAGFTETKLIVDLEKTNNIRVFINSDTEVELKYRTAPDDDKHYSFLFQIHNPSEHKVWWPMGYWDHGGIPDFKQLSIISGYVNSLYNEFFFFYNGSRMESNIKTRP